MTAVKPSVLLAALLALAAPAVAAAHADELAHVHDAAGATSSGRAPDDDHDHDHAVEGGVPTILRAVAGAAVIALAFAALAAWHRRRSRG